MSIIEVSAAECKDCYKCLRACPVKAITVQNGRARVWEERCILDGACLHVCPQQAKKVRDDIPTVKKMLAGGEKVAVSLAPSHIVSGLGTPGKLVAAVRALGFSWVEETTVVAGAVAKAHADLAPDKTYITSSCPAVVNLVERHYPALLPHLAPVASPMVTHGRSLHERLGEGWRVVFIGPCVAKKQEAQTQGGRGVDAVLTFTELGSWLKSEGIVTDKLSEQPFDGPSPGVAQLFPLAGGLLRTACLPTDSLSSDVATVTGVRNCISFLRELSKGESKYRLVEMLACEGGCINGPCISTNTGLYERHRQVLQCFTGSSGKGTGLDVEPEQLESSYQDRSVPLPQPTEEEIQSILRSIGKTTPADELNCGACGYDSCRAKAVSVFWGVAEREMCIPYMRRKAESLANLMKQETLVRAQEVIDQQMRVAQEIAGLLGETTAETKTLLTKLMQLIRDEGETYQ